MIRYADNTSRPLVRKMWKTCFGDPEEYMDIYFREMYRDRNTLIYFDGGEAVASLQMLPFRFTFYGEEIPVAYFSGLCTMPQARRKGFMGALIRKSFEEMNRRGWPLALLVPQDQALIDFYRPFGFGQTFDAGIPLPDLREIMENTASMRTAYHAFDSFFRQRDMTVQKTFHNFRAIVEEASLFDFPEKKSLTGMSRVVNAETLLTVFAKKEPQKKISLKISDELMDGNSFVYHIEHGKVAKARNEAPAHDCLPVDELAQLLLGYKTVGRRDDLAEHFPDKQPIIGYMME